MDVKYSGFMQFRFVNDRTRSGDAAFTRRQFGYILRFSPTPRIAQVSLEGLSGQEIDFDNSRPGRGSTINLSARVNVTDHLELSAVANQRWLDVQDAREGRRRLFTARVSRLRATYMFSANSFARVVGQYVSETRVPELYVDSVSRRSGTFTGSALVAYKINWQSVLFVGYGDDREISEQERLARSSRQLFVKMSYAFQR
jgi:hypothetical protein